MRVVQYWSFIQDCKNLNALTAQKRTETVSILKDKDFAKDNYFINYLSEAMDGFSDPEVLDVFKNLCQNYNWYSHYSYTNDTIYKLTHRAYALDPVLVRSEIANSNAKNPNTESGWDRLFLSFPNPTIDEEVRGLRAISQSKHIPHMIYKAKYAPTKAALDQLPPIMRLKTLEHLSSNKHLAYNIFINFPDPDEFKVMMFSSITRHRERAEGVWQKYQEIAYLGQPAEIKITTRCDNCGETEMSMKSTRVRTKAGLKSTTIWNTYRYGGCPLCGQHAKSISVIGREDAGL